MCDSSSLMLHCYDFVMPPRAAFAIPQAFAKRCVMQPLPASLIVSRSSTEDDVFMIKSLLDRKVFTSMLQQTGWLHQRDDAEIGQNREQRESQCA